MPKQQTWIFLSPGWLNSCLESHKNQPLLSRFVMYTKRYCSSIEVWLEVLPQGWKCVPRETCLNHKWISSTRKWRDGGGKRERRDFWDGPKHAQLHEDRDDSYLILRPWGMSMISDVFQQTWIIVWNFRLLRKPPRVWNHKRKDLWEES